MIRAAGVEDAGLPGDSRLARERREGVWMVRGRITAVSDDQVRFHVEGFFHILNAPHLYRRFQPQPLGATIENIESIRRHDAGSQQHGVGACPPGNVDIMGIEEEVGDPIEEAPAFAPPPEADVVPPAQAGMPKKDDPPLKTDAAVYRTDRGFELDRESFVRHVAIKFARVDAQ